MSRVLFFALSVSLLLPGCGRKTPVKPPELAAPEPISDLRAENREGGVRLAWTRPQIYVDGSRMRNLGGFRIQRSVRDGPWEMLAELPLDDQTRFRQVKRLRYLDDTARNDVEYGYRVLSFTLDSYVSLPSNVLWILRELPTPAKQADQDPK